MPRRKARSIGNGPASTDASVPGQAPMSYRAHPCVACWLRQATHSLRATAGYSSSLAFTGRCHPLPSLRRGLVSAALCRTVTVVPPLGIGRIELDQSLANGEAVATGSERALQIALLLQRRRALFRVRPLWARVHADCLRALQRLRESQPPWLRPTARLQEKPTGCCLA